MKYSDWTEMPEPIPPTKEQWAEWIKRAVKEIIEKAGISKEELEDVER